MSVNYPQRGGKTSVCLFRVAKRREGQMCREFGVGPHARGPPARRNAAASLQDIPRNLRGDLRKGLVCRVRRGA